MPSSDFFDWRGYPKGTFFKYGTRVFAIVNKNYAFSLDAKRNCRISWNHIETKDATVFGYVPSDFFK